MTVTVNLSDRRACLSVKCCVDGVVLSASMPATSWSASSSAVGAHLLRSPRPLAEGAGELPDR